VELTEDYFARHGMMAFVFGRFIPVVRTFLPILAGIAKISLQKFWIYNLLGATLWVSSVVMAGYWLSHFIPGLTEHLGSIAVVMIVVSTLPLLISVINNKRAAAKK